MTSSAAAAKSVAAKDARKKGKAKTAHKKTSVALKMQTTKHKEREMSEWPAADDEYMLKHRQEGMSFKEIADNLETYAYAVKERHSFLAKREKYERAQQAKLLEAAKERSRLDGISAAKA
jgi:hypothetical protein